MVIAEPLFVLTCLDRIKKMEFEGKNTPVRAIWLSILTSFMARQVLPLQKAV
jgi:hypothetical protein